MHLQSQAKQDLFTLCGWVNPKVSSNCQFTQHKDIHHRINAQFKECSGLLLLQPIECYWNNGKTEWTWFTSGLELNANIPGVEYHSFGIIIICAQRTLFSLYIYISLDAGSIGSVTNAVVNCQRRRTVPTTMLIINQGRLSWHDLRPY